MKNCYKEYLSEESLDPKSMIETLIEKLYQKYNSKVYLLIDNYDMPLISALSTNFISKVLEFYQ